MDTSFQFVSALGHWLDAPLSRHSRPNLAAALFPILKVRGREGEALALRLNRAQLELACDPSPRKIVLKARQLGITTWVAAHFFLRTVTRPGTLTVQVAHDQESAEEIFKIVRRFYDNLPESMRVTGVEPVWRTSRANVRQLVFPALDSEYRVETAADPNAGRGLTIQNLHCSEVARWPRFAAETLASLRAAVPASGAIILESTPNGAAGCFYQEWQRAAETGYSRHFFPWWYEDAHRRSEDPHPLSDQESKLAQRHGLDDAQIAFRRHAHASLAALAPQEFCEDAESCFLSSGECIFDLAAIDERLKFCAQQFCELRENGSLRIWYPPSAARKYVIGADPAGGSGNGDYSCAQVVDLATGLQCAELRGHFPPQEFAQRCAALAREYSNALLVIERNNHGHAVLAHLKNEAANCGPLDLYEQNGQLGWLTTAANRPQMIANFAATLAAEPRLFSSPLLLQECRTFVRQSNGTASAASGAHDDCVLAMALALAVRGQQEHK